MQVFSSPSLFKKFLDLVFPGFTLRAMLCPAFDRHLVELTQQFFLHFGKLDRRLDNHKAKQNTRKARAHPLDTFAPQAEGLAGLGSLRNSESHLTGQRRHFDFSAKRSLDERNRHFAMQIVALTLKHRMLLDMNFHIQVARRPAIHAWLAVSGRADARAGGEAGGERHFQRLVALDASRAAAGSAWFR